MNETPLLLITLGDVAGIGPEIVARAWPDLLPLCRPVVIGDSHWLTRAIERVGSPASVQPLRDMALAEPTPLRIPCLDASTVDLGGVRPGMVGAAGGRAAYDFLC